MKMTGVSKATATRDLSEMVERGQLWSHGVGKAVRYYVNVPGWSLGVALGPSPKVSTGFFASNTKASADFMVDVERMPVQERKF